MSCPPSPGVLAMLLADPLRIAALLLSLGAVVSALVLARRRADHGPIRILCVVWVADVFGWLLAPALASGGPFAGWMRMLQHLDSARFLLWPLSVQIMVGLSFIEPDQRHGAARVLRVALPSFYALMLVICVACYPWLRGEPLGRFYACIQSNAVLWSVVVAGAWLARKAKRETLPCHLRGCPEEVATPARVVASLVVALQMLSIVAGPWWRGLFGAAYRAEQVILCVLYAAILGVQLWAWHRAPEGEGRRHRQLACPHARADGPRCPDCGALGCPGTLDNGHCMLDPGHTGKHQFFSELPAQAARVQADPEA